MIAEEPDDNPGDGLTHLADVVVAVACRKFNIDPARLARIAHYADGGSRRPTWDLVTWEVGADGRSRRADWRPMTASDRVEIG